MHSICFMETHEVTHRRGNEFAAARYFHVNIGIRDNGPALGVDDLSVNARMMINFFIQHLEGAGLGKVTVATARNRRFQNNGVSPQQESHLFFQIDLDAKRICIFCCG